MRPSEFAPSRSWVILLAVCLYAPIPAGADEPDHEKVSIKIRPVVLFAGGQVRTTVRTPRDPRNRELRVIVESTDFYASSDVQLDGVDAATSHQFVWKDLPGGPYRVDAILLRENGEKTTVSECFAVMSGDDGETSVGQSFPTRRRQQRPAPRPDTMGMKSGC